VAGDTQKRPDITVGQHKMNMLQSRGRLGAASAGLNPRPGGLFLSRMLRHFPGGPRELFRLHHESIHYKLGKASGMETAADDAPEVWGTDSKGCASQRTIKLAGIRRPVSKRRQSCSRLTRGLAEHPWYWHIPRLAKTAYRARRLGRSARSNMADGVAQFQASKANHELRKSCFPMLHSPQRRRQLAPSAMSPINAYGTIWSNSTLAATSKTNPQVAHRRF
jgi:hypothetical protein